MSAKDFQLPKNTPAWGVGLVSIIISLGITFAGMYATVRAEVKYYLEAEIKNRSEAAEAQKNNISMAFETIKINSVQIATLSSAINAIEKDLETTRDELTNYKNKFTDCDLKLSLCNRGK